MLKQIKKCLGIRFILTDNLLPGQVVIVFRFDLAIDKLLTMPWLSLLVCPPLGV